MAHAYKKTLLAQLGFADADKQNPKHDLAVEYLALPHNAKRLTGGLFKGIGWDASVRERGEVVESEGKPWRICEWEHALDRLTAPERERPLTKGSDRYKTTVGFLDLVLHWSFRSSHAYRFYLSDGTESTSERRDSFQRHIAAIEVKATPVPTGDLLRQMKLYREYESELCGYSSAKVHWFVAACFKFTETQAAALKQEGFRPITLGPLFDEWAEAKKNDRTLASNVEEF